MAACDRDVAKTHQCSGQPRRHLGDLAALAPAGVQIEGLGEDGARSLVVAQIEHRLAHRPIRAGNEVGLAGLAEQRVRGARPSQGDRRVALMERATGAGPVFDRPEPLRPVRQRGDRLVDQVRRGGEIALIDRRATEPEEDQPLPRRPRPVHVLPRFLQQTTHLVDLGRVVPVEREAPHRVGDEVPVARLPRRVERLEEDGPHRVGSRLVDRATRTELEEIGEHPVGRGGLREPGTAPCRPIRRRPRRC